MTKAQAAVQAHPTQNEPPLQRGGIVPRAALTSRIDTALNAEKKLVLVKGPAGYGKTTLLRQFRDSARASNRRRVWISLSPSDSDPVQFVSTLITSYISAAGDIDFSVISLPDRLSRSPDAALDDLISLMRSQSVGSIFFIDEYQNAANSEVDHLLKVFLQQAPPNVATILAVRDEPSCGLSKMRLDGEMAEIAQTDLAFGVEDIYQLFEDVDLSQPDIEVLYEKTRGWPAALCLAKLWLNNGCLSSSGVARFSGDLPELASYLAEEVFSALPEDVQTFLRATSLLRYFDAEIADALLGRRDSAQMLRRLQSLNAFVFPADPSTDGYVYHPLLADYLRSCLYAEKTPEDIEELHGIAADHFNKKGQYLFALEHAIDAGDQERIEQIFDQEEFGLLLVTVDCEAFFRIMRRVEKTDPNIKIRLRPTYAFYRMKEGDYEGAERLLQETGEELDDPKSEAYLTEKARRYTQAEHALITAVYHIYTDKWDGVEDIVSGLGQKLQDNDIAHPLYVAVLNNALGMLQFRLGSIDDALTSFHNAVEKFNEANSQYGVVHNDLHAAMIAMLKSDMPLARKYIVDARARCNRYLSGDYNLSAVINISSALELYERGVYDDLRALISSARAAVLASGDYWVELLENAFRIDARLQFSENGLSAAFSLLGQGLEIAKEGKFQRFKDFLIADKIHLAALSNDLKLAGELVREQGWALDEARVDIDGYGWRERIAQAVALTRLEIARKNPEAALAALDRFDMTFNGTGLTRLIIKSKVLRSLALFVDGQHQEAAALVRELIETGEKLGLRSFFLEEGLLAQELLDETARRFQRSKKADEFNDTVLKWLIASFSYVPSTQLPESPRLSSQQKRILELLAQGLDRQEIAAQSNTTIHNVQYHLKKMFDLFGVTSSARLVAETVRLNLVDDRTARLSHQ